MLHKQNLFEARTHGYKTYRIPGIAVTTEGTVLVSTEARPGAGGDYDYNDVLIRRSTDGGSNFSPFTKLIDHEKYGNGPVSNFMMIPDHGMVHALFCHDYARIFYMHSTDDGLSFSEPVDITSVVEHFRNEYDWKVCATGPGHGLRLRNGRLVIPVWLSDGSSGEFGSNHRGHRPSDVVSIYSDDKGKTWQHGDFVARTGEKTGGVTLRYPSETVAVELEDGSVLFNLRSESANNRRLLASSPDGSSNWTIRGFDPVVKEPVCMSSILRYSWTGNGEAGRIIFANPDTLEKEMQRVIDPHTDDKPHCDRKNLTVRISEDDCVTWAYSRVLESGPSGYSDLGVLPDGTILCLYECDIVEHIYDDKYLCLARFDLDWVRSGNE